MEKTILKNIRIDSDNYKSYIVTQKITVNFLSEISINNFRIEYY